MSASTANSKSKALNWIATAGLAFGIGALFELVVIAWLLPVEAEAGLSASAVIATGDLAIRSAGLLIFFCVSAVLIVWSARPSTVLALREPGSLPAPRE